MPILDGLGPAKWDDFPILDGPAGEHELTIDGYAIEIGLWGTFQNTPLPSGVAVQMGDGTHAYQCTMPKATQPLTMGPFQQSFAFTVTHQEHMVRIRRASAIGLPVLAFFGMYHEDVWSIPNGETGQTEWRTSRRIGWNGTTRTHVTHPPYAAIQTGSTLVEQTIVTTAPAAGEVQVPTSQTADLYYDSIITPALTAGDKLIVRYWPEMLCRIVVVDSFQMFNVWELAVEVTELLAGEY